MKPEEHPLVKAWIEFAKTNHFCEGCIYPWDNDSSKCTCKGKTKRLSFSYTFGNIKSDIAFLAYMIKGGHIK